MKKIVFLMFLAIVTLAPFQMPERSGMVSFYNNKIPYSAFFGYQRVENTPIQKGERQSVVPVNKEDPTSTEKE